MLYCLKKKNGAEYELLDKREPDSKGIIAPGTLMWKTDYENLLLHRDKKGTPQVPLNSIIEKYVIKTR